MMSRAIRVAVFSTVAFFVSTASTAQAGERVGAPSVIPTASSIVFDGLPGAGSYALIGICAFGPSRSRRREAFEKTS